MFKKEKNNIIWKLKHVIPQYINNGAIGLYCMDSIGATRRFVWILWEQPDVLYGFYESNQTFCMDFMGNSMGLKGIVNSLLKIQPQKPTTII